MLINELPSVCSVEKSGEYFKEKEEQRLRKDICLIIPFCVKQEIQCNKKC